MIRQVDLNGFKSFDNTSIVLKNLTMLTGLNSSGKSSIIQAIEMADIYFRTSGRSFMLNGHGNLKEHINTMSNRFDIDVLSENYSVHLSSVLGESQMKGDFTDSIFYLEAGRTGGMNSIAIYNEGSEIGSKGENVIKCIATHRDDIIPSPLCHPDTEGETFYYNLNAWLNMISPNVKFDYQVNEMSDDSYATYNGHRTSNVGYGLSYTLPIIATLLRASVMPGSIVLIENPEAHLHPKGQTEMGKMIACAVKAGVQVVVETHSDHLFDGIRISAKQMEGLANQFLGYWFALDKNGVSHWENVQINDNGRLLTEAPAGFCDQFEINAMKLL